MNKLEYEMIETLKRLKNDYGCIQIKAEFENEGSRQVELCRLKDVISKVDIPLILKIGGVEAVTDIYEALTIGAKGIVAPMAETAYALSKFIDAVEKFVPKDNREDVEFAVNIETITAYENFEKMLKLKNIDVLQSVTVGRVDFTGSLGEDRNYVDTVTMRELCKNIFSKAKAKNLRTALGGAISSASETFLETLTEENLLNKYETRKIVYDIEGLKTYKEGLEEGIKFELQWLKSKERYYHLIAIEDEKRIKMLEERVNG
ncbi:MAG: citrate lyase beta subunit [PVC group bacterium]|nr:citrate lyase beta subunit [PVC group bacterium]